MAFGRLWGRFRLFLSEFGVKRGSSELSGGKFADGFRNGVIAAGLDHVAHRGRRPIDKAKLKAKIEEDGKLTLKEANKWYRRGGGDPLNIDASKIDLNFPPATARCAVSKAKLYATANKMVGL